MLHPFLYIKGQSTADSDEGKHLRSLVDPMVLAIADDVWDAVKDGFNKRFWDQGDITWYKITMVRLTQTNTYKLILVVIVYGPYTDIVHSRRQIMEIKSETVK